MDMLPTTGKLCSLEKTACSFFFFFFFPPNILNTEEENSETIRNAELKVSFQIHHAERFLLLESDQPRLASFSSSGYVMEK